MNDERTGADRSEESPIENEPRFGAVDIVEAFTAMRHEWRGQTKETRALAEQVAASTASLRSMESKLLACVADNRLDDSAEARKFALSIVEIDRQLTRALAAVAQWEATRQRNEEADAAVVERRFAGMGRIARWFARPLISLIDEQRAERRRTGASPVLEGLDLVLARLRRDMRERGIERVETLGLPFDPATMHAIGIVAAGSVDANGAAHCPPGHVAEQISPAYRWQGRLLCFADVRVAGEPPNGKSHARREETSNVR